MRYFDVWLYDDGTKSFYEGDEPSASGTNVSLSDALESKLVECATIGVVAGKSDVVFDASGLTGKAVYVTVDDDFNFVRFE